MEYWKKKICWRRNKSSYCKLRESEWQHWKSAGRWISVGLEFCRESCNYQTLACLTILPTCYVCGCNLSLFYCRTLFCCSASHHQTKCLKCKLKTGNLIFLPIFCVNKSDSQMSYALVACNWYNQYNQSKLTSLASHDR